MKPRFTDWLFGQLSAEYYGVTIGQIQQLVNALTVLELIEYFDMYQEEVASL